MTLQIIDTHQHLWDLDQINPPWIEEVPALNRSFLMADYNQQTDATGSTLDYQIEQSIYMEVDADESDMRREIEYVKRIAAEPDNGLSGMIAATRPGEPAFRSQMSQAIDDPFVLGFRRVLHTNETPRGTCLKPDFLEDIRRMGKAGKTFDICIRREELTDAKSMIESCPETQFILDHCGNADVRIAADQFAQWQKNMLEIGQLKNVACKVSGFVWTIQNPDWTYESNIEPILSTVVDSFGTDRILFGGDWPVCTQSVLSFPTWIESLHRFATARGEEVPDKLFRKTAVRVYGLEADPANPK